MFDGDAIVDARVTPHFPDESVKLFLVAELEVVVVGERIH